MGRQHHVVKFPHNIGDCTNCENLQRCVGKGLTSSDLKDLQGITALPKLFKRGQRLFREGDPLNYLFMVRSGAVKTYKVLSAGDEQILDFHLPGAMIGFDALTNNIYNSHATALDTTCVCAFRFDTMADVFRRSLNTQKAFLRLISTAINHEQRLLITLGSKAATQRIAAFLEMLSSYHRDRGYSATQFSLPMSRTDIANYLSLAVETVSRTLTKMQRDGTIDLSRNEISILDLPRLQQMANDPDKELIAVSG
ncbi:MAG: helix-turn-helix domain-containing protein [Saprospiraceae bacterium]|nr:helix-turn-helix domain-containing protein [Saprospiraceae bacterium]